MITKASLSTTFTIYSTNREKPNKREAPCVRVCSVNMKWFGRNVKHKFSTGVVENKKLKNS